MASQWTFIDDFVDVWVAKHGNAPFSAKDVEDWFRSSRRPGWDRQRCSMLLQTHRHAHRHQNAPRYVLGCTHPGRDAQWFVAGPDDAYPMLQRVCDEKARAVVKDVVCRVNPAAELDLPTAAAIAAVEQSVGLQLQALGAFLMLEVPSMPLARSAATV